MLLLYACPSMSGKGWDAMAKTRPTGPVRDVAMDLGTSMSLVAVRGRGILLREPSVVAVDRHTGKVLQAGEAARQLLGRTPGQVLAVRPLGEGVLRDGGMAEAMIRVFLHRAAPGRVLRPRLLLGVPTGAAQVSEQALVEAGLRAGARRVYLMEEPLAAALGAGLDVESARGRMVVDVGGGATDAAVLALGGIVASACLPVAGDAFDRAILQYVRARHGLLIGRRTAEEVKRAVGRLSALGEGEQLPPFAVRGRCLTTGLPWQTELTGQETAVALDPVAEELARGVQEVLERTPPELAEDVAEAGILLVGGGSLLPGLDSLLSERTGIPVIRGENPEDAVVLGLEQALDHLSRRQDGVLDLARRRAVTGE